MTAPFPENIKNFEQIKDLQSNIEAANINDAYNEITLIETVLGSQVAGSKDTLAERLDTSLDSQGNLKSGVLSGSSLVDHSIQNVKIYNEDTFDFNKINIGKHQGNSTYGYTASAGHVSQYSGLTVDSSGNISTNGDVLAKGVGVFKNDADEVRPCLTLSTSNYENVLEATKDEKLFLAANSQQFWVRSYDNNDTQSGIGIRNLDNKQVVVNHRNAYGSGQITLSNASTASNGQLQIKFTEDNKTYIGTTEAASISIQTAATNRIYISDDGKIGVKTVTPSADFQVQGNEIITGNSNIGSATIGSASISSTLNVTGKLTGSDADFTGNLSVSGNSTLGNNSTDTVSIPGSANISETLNVTKKITGSDASFSDTVAFNKTSTSPFTVSSSAVVSNLNADLIDGTHLSSIAQTGGSGTSGKIAKFTGTSSIENSIISESGGKIGINMTPTKTLDVSGDSKIDGDLTVTGDLYVEGSEFVTVTETLIGSQIVTNSLTVSGNSTLGNETTDTVTIPGSASISETLNVTKKLTGSDADFTGSLSVSGNSTLGNAAADSVTIPGSASITGKLNVGGKLTGSDADLTGSLSVSGNSKLGYDTADSVTIPGSASISGALNVGGSTNLVASTSSGKITANAGISTNEINVDSNTIYTSAGVKKVGINTSAPDTFLTIDVGSGTNQGFDVKTGTKNIAFVGNLSASAEGVISLWHESAQRVKICANSDSFINSGNSFGINIISPTETLDVNGTATVSGSAKFGSTLNVTGKLTGSDADLTGNLSVSGNSTLGNAAADTVSIPGSASITGNLNVGGKLTGSDASFSDTVAFNRPSTSPFTVSSSAVVSNLNADLIDGAHLSSIAQTGGSGTPGKIAKFTGTSSIENSIISESSGKIGINMAPTKTLDVSGSIGASSVIYTGIVRSYNVSGISFVDQGGSVGLFLKEGGRVGFGNQNPQYDVDASGKQIYCNNLKSTYIQTTDILANDSDGIGILDDSGNYGIYVKDGGNVGMGTVNPLEKLQIKSESSSQLSLQYLSQKATFTFDNLTNLTIHVPNNIALLCSQCNISGTLNVTGPIYGTSFVGTKSIYISETTDKIKQTITKPTDFTDFGENVQFRWFELTLTGLAISPGVETEFDVVFSDLNGIGLSGSAVVIAANTAELPGVVPNYAVYDVRVYKKPGISTTNTNWYLKGKIQKMAEDAGGPMSFILRVLVSVSVY